MDAVRIVNDQLPATAEELSKFVIVGREKLTAVRAELRAITKVGLAAEIRQQKLQEAQEIADVLLAAEIRLGELIAEIPERPGKRTDLQTEPPDSDVQRSKAEILQDLGIPIKTAQRLERLASKKDVALSMAEKAREDGEVISRTEVLKAIAKPYITNNSGNTEWYTPRIYIESARKVMGSIDLDPASSKEAQRVVQASNYYDSEIDGLRQEWYGNVWLNPPYSNVKKFAEKLLDSTFEQAIVLVNNATETEWFSALAERSSAMVFHTGRIRFASPDSHGEGTTPCMQGQVFLYFGKQKKTFITEFSKYGWGLSEYKVSTK